MTTSIVSLRQFVFLMFCLTSISACSVRNVRPEATVPETIAEKQPSEMERAQGQISQLQNKIQDLETRLTALNDKMNGQTETKVIQPPAASGKIVPVVRAKKSEHDAVTLTHGNNDEAVDRYREGKILFDSKRYSDAVIEFSDFTKNFATHTFAPAAQYFLGMSYLNQKEYKLAEEELNRGLITYPHSHYTADTLKSLQEVSELLKKPEKVAYYKQKIAMLFTNSPTGKGNAETLLKAEPEHQEREFHPAPTIEKPSIETPTIESPADHTSVENG